jgi:predicted pyridoxine 5'-phosphate oxidase superfamily flavin-nucleotide-binding protein
MEIPRHWRLKKQRYGLIGTIDSNGQPEFPPTPVGKFGNDDQARVLAIEAATKKADANLIVYTAEMIKAKIKYGVKV